MYVAIALSGSGIIHLLGLKLYPNDSSQESVLLSSSYRLFIRMNSRMNSDSFNARLPFASLQRLKTECQEQDEHHTL